MGEGVRWQFDEKYGGKMKMERKWGSWRIDGRFMEIWDIGVRGLVSFIK